MLGSLAELLPVRSRYVLVDGPADEAGLFASRLAEELGARGSSLQVTLAAGEPADATIFLRTAPGGRHSPVYRKDREDREDREGPAAEPAPPTATTTPARISTTPAS